MFLVPLFLDFVEFLFSFGGVLFLGFGFSGKKYVFFFFFFKCLFKILQ